jgi:hypothetical protein
MPYRAGGGLIAMAAPALRRRSGSGATARIEYNDNYFFTPVDAQSAFTGTITPFITAARRTETSNLRALVAVGANEVWGISPTIDYLSGRIQLDGSVREARSTWSGSASFGRSASLQYETGQGGTAFMFSPCRFRVRRIQPCAYRELVT